MRLNYNSTAFLLKKCTTNVVHSSYRLTSSGAAESVAAGVPSMAVDEVTLPPLFAASRQAPPASPPAILPAMETAQSLDSHCAPTLMSTASPAAAPTTNSQYDTDPINFEYMRHVLLKFFLSHDSEVSLNSAILVTTSNLVV